MLYMYRVIMTGFSSITGLQYIAGKQYIADL
jgi:hypothetical protein